MIMLLVTIGLIGLIIKRTKVTYACLFGIIWILMAGCTDGADYNNYVLNYFYTNTYSSSGWEPLYQLSVLFAKKLGFDFRTFFMFYSLVGLFLIAYTFYKLSNRYIFAFLLYFIYPFCMDVVQIRNFMCIAIILFSFQFLTKEGNGNILKFCLGVLIATGFHRSGFIFLSLVLIKIISERKLKLIALSVVAFTTVIYPNLGRIATVLTFIPVAKLHYLTDGTAARTKALVLAYLVISYLFFYYLYKKMAVKADEDNLKKIYKYVFLSNVICVALYPLFIASVSFLRLHRAIALINYVAITNYNVKNERYLIYLSGIIYAAVSFIAFIGLYNWDTVVRAIFESNWILE